MCIRDSPLTRSLISGETAETSALLARERADREDLNRPGPRATKLREFQLGSQKSKHQEYVTALQRHVASSKGVCQKLGGCQQLLKYVCSCIEILDHQRARVAFHNCHTHSFRNH
eukprot:5425978-Amphidinium_carterae.1